MQEAWRTTTRADPGHLMTKGTMTMNTVRQPTTTSVFDTYWQFAAARQEAFFARLDRPAAGVWTHDPILQQYKFTNAYRAADRVSQYLIRHVIYQGDQGIEEVFFRTLLFKIFNKIETWERLASELGEISWRAYDCGRLDSILSRAMAGGEAVFSAAYIMPSGASAFGSPRKHLNFLALLERMMADRLPLRLAQLPSLEAVYQALRSYPLMGDFLAFQYTIDLLYGPGLPWEENDFVVAGPGALSGISKCFSDTGGMSAAEIIRWTTERQDLEFDRLGLRFRSLWGRALRLIDCQNLFCEVNKYARVAHPDVAGGDGRTQIKQVFRPTRAPIAYWFPPKWGINDRIPAPTAATEAVAARRPVQASLF